MLGIALALIAARTTMPDSLTRDPDLRCLAAVSAALGIVADRKDADPETVPGLTAVFMYFLGKVDAARPGLDYAPPLARLMNSPTYANDLPADLKRCGAEAEGRGQMLQDLADKLRASVRFGRPGAG